MEPKDESGSQIKLYPDEVGDVERTAALLRTEEERKVRDYLNQD